MTKSQINKSDALNLSDDQYESYANLGIQPISVKDVEATVAAMTFHAGCNLPEDFVRALIFGLKRERNPVGREIIGRLLINASEAAQAGRPACQDTGQAVVFLEIGQDVRIVDGDLEQAVDRGVSLGYKTLRNSVVKDALFDRSNTGDNTPAIVHAQMVPGRTLTIHAFEKGYGSENKCFMIMYPYPNEGEDAVVKYVVEGVSKIGADWCPPGMLSVAVGSDFEGAPKLAKRALLQPFDMDLLLQKAESSPDELTPHERLRIRLFNAVNDLGIGPQGLGGNTHVLDVKLTTAPTHIAGLPIAVNVQCNKAHHISATLDGSGPLTEFPKTDYSKYLAELDAAPEGEQPRRISFPMDEETRKSLRAGERVLVTGKLLTARDAAHKRLIDALNKGQDLPVNLDGQVIYYVGPVPPVQGEIIGPAGPTTASRMDPYTPPLLETTGLAGAIGKAERGPAVVEAFKRAGAIYFIAIGGYAYAQSKTIEKVKVLAYDDLGPEAIRELTVKDFPVVVAIDAERNNIHRIGRNKYAVTPGD